MTRHPGQSLIEVTVGIVVLAPVLLVLMDLGLILLAVQSNDSICRNAARAAACGDPIDARARAQAIIDRANYGTQRTPFSTFLLASAPEVTVISRPLPQEDPLTSKQRNPGGPITGSTTVTTEVDISPFLVQNLAGTKSPMKFRSRQSFPITYIEPAG